MEDLIPNYTLFIQLGIFLASYLVLNQLVFKPYVKLIHAREAVTSGMKEKAVADGEAANKFRADYESFLRDERKKLNAELEVTRVEISESERKVIAAARQQASGELAASRSKLKGEYEEARKQLAPLVSEYSSQIVSKLVGKSIKVPASLKNPPRTQTEQTV